MISNPWKSTSVRTALEGRSFIDSKKIHIHTEKDANDFIESYGFRLDDLDDLRELQSIQTEAIDLIKSELLLSHEKIPKTLVQQTNISQYLLIASGHGKKSEAPWAGSILRVMHTLIHSHSYLNDIYHDVIREQIFDRFEEKVKETNGETYFGPIKLEKLEFRKAKTRRSVAMKLLHKAENVAADIFDWIGIRFITQHRVDVIDLLAFLRNEHIITFANIKPSRSRNTLIDLDWFDQKLKEGMSIDSMY
ncbi:TIGR04552 family protein [Aliikangiella sp. IMCC44359]|uniref:TIGR04552 family protein n=1 Tax=Aliikangiella sp. IMCC44359 TaxID=3459125 RepID=UPI00403B27F3